MPDTAEIDPLMLQLDDRRDFREAVDPVDHGIGHRRAETAGEGELLRRRYLLIAEDDDQMIEQRLPDRRDGGVGQAGRQIDATDFGADRRGNRRDLEAAGGC